AGVERDDAQRFVDCIRRATEEPHLLAADNGNGAFFQTLQIGFGFRAMAITQVLIAQDSGYGEAAVARKIELLRVGSDSLQIRRMGEEPLDGREILIEIAKELRRVWQVLRWKGAAMHGRLDDNRSQR